MTKETERAALGACPVLASAREETREALARAAEPLTPAAGELVFREGDPAPYVFFVEEGALVAEKRAEDGVEIPLREVLPGELGGLTNLEGTEPRSASLRARTAARLLAIDKGVLRERMAGDPGLARGVLAALGSKIRAKNRQLATLLERTRRDPRERIVFFDAKPYEREAFDARMPEDLRVRYVEARLGPDTARLADGYPVACAFVNDDLSRPVLEELAARGVRLLAMRCAGYNNVDLPAAAALGLDVVRVPAYSPHAVAEHTIALLLTLVRKTHRAFARVREGNFSLAGLVGTDMFGKTAGVVGAGKIGAIVAKILLGMGMRVLVFDPRPDAALTALGARYATLDELFAESDVLSLHVPLTAETHHMVDRARLATVKPGLVLLNTSRGGLVDAAALVEALKEDRIGAAGLDVYEEESEYFFQDRSDRAVADDLLARLMTFPNVLITSHQAFLTREALDNIAEATLASVDEHLRGAPLTRAVRP